MYRFVPANYPSARVNSPDANSSSIMAVTRHLPR